MVHPRILLITYPLQGHINPALEFAKRLARMGIDVTFATTVFAHQHMMKAAEVPEGLRFVTFSDGLDDGGFKVGVTDAKQYSTEFRIRGSNTLRDIITQGVEQGRPITTVVYTLLLVWAGEVARESEIQSALLWIQAASVFDIYHYYFNGYEDEITTHCKDPNWSIQLPGLPLLCKSDLPSFLVPPIDSYTNVLPTLKEQLDILERSPMVLVNTFDAFELEALKAIGKHKLIAVGPLVPQDTSSGEDFPGNSVDYMEWLNSKPKSSVVYVSFGSMLEQPKEQMEEIARGLLETGRPLLWVIRKKKKTGEDQEENEELSFDQELRQRGMIVPWCSQLEVLRHPSLGCFVTHCGWNSTLESIACGVPVVAFQKLSDQGTNAKLIQDVWKTGVRVAENEDGIVSKDEIKRCVEIIMDGGERGLELRRNANKWKDLARKAMQEGGSSYRNLKLLF